MKLIQGKSKTPAGVFACCASGRTSGIVAPSVARWLAALACGSVLFGTLTTQAQQVYRIVGPDGRVMFSDKPPATPAAKVTSTDNTVATNQPVGPALPFELRQVVAKYPVTIYTSGNCAPCDSGRSLLTARGVPFSEKTVATALDADALQRFSGSTSLPFLTIGAQHVAGYSPSEWTQYLNAAGYPERSKLPAGYRSSAATPLTVPEKPAAVETPVPAVQVSRPAVAPVAPRPNPGNPAGIQF
ncbi:MAG: glutaredoxin family protein [Rhodoferax sp.]|uniref:glutaredoxin family protein n=1 Tax=Rhodoferax sp. TaxID=50421 RepID=UPI00261D077C|nr:glutaredoxin family protein [Rhodoferax sp.]MDD2882377.1 glutaredoxin family protein [Rhodoferax sp.]